MSGKLLVVGDSFADRYLENYRWNPFHRDVIWSEEVNNTKISNYWFDSLSKKLNLKLLNLSHCGCGNKQIFDNTFDAITNKKDVSLAVVMWTEFNRLDIEADKVEGARYINYHPQWGEYESETSSIVPPGSRNFMYKEWIKIHTHYDLHNEMRGVDNFLRYSHSLNLLAKERNIRLIQCFGCIPSWSNETIKYFIDCELTHKLDENNYVGYPFFEKIGGFSLQERFRSNDVLSKDDNHPNQNGNNLIFNILLEKYEEVISGG